MFPLSQPLNHNSFTRGPFCHYYEPFHGLTVVPQTTFQSAFLRLSEVKFDVTAEVTARIPLIPFSFTIAREITSNELRQSDAKLMDGKHGNKVG